MPPELGNLDSFSASNNDLSGPMPSELGNLNHLDVSNNNLSGPIPPELGNLTWLYASHNQLSGLIPPELGNLYHLDASSILYLAELYNNGGIPRAIISLVDDVDKTKADVIRFCAVFSCSIGN